MIDELERLNRYRLDNDLTYEKLAARVGLSHKTLYALLQSPSTQPFDRTLHKIRRFFAELDEQPTAAPTPRRRAATR